MQGSVAGRAPAARVGGARIAARKASNVQQRSVRACAALKDGQKLDRKLRVAVIGGGPAGACTAETLAAGGIETVMIERKMDNCKVRGASYLSICAWEAQDGSLWFRYLA